VVEAPVDAQFARALSMFGDVADWRGGHPMP
jgi:hypothetical protein